MARINKYKEVIKGKLIETPKKLQKQIATIREIMIKKTDELLQDPIFKFLTDDRRSSKKLDKFKSPMKDKIGNVMVYQIDNKRYGCMIQLMNHFENSKTVPNGKLLNKLLARIYKEINPIINKKYDMDLDHESEEGYEGFDIYLSNDGSKELFNQLSKVETLTESEELIDNIESYIEESSHSTLNQSTRLTINPENGHFIKIIFDLNPEDIKKSNINGIDYMLYGNNPKTIKLKKVNKLGDYDFLSIGTPLAIIDLDTNQKLKTVKTIGPFDKNFTKFTHNIPVRDREIEIKKFEFNPNHIKTVTVDEKETNPSYKTTNTNIKNIADIKNDLSSIRMSNIMDPKIKLRGVKQLSLANKIKKFNNLKNELINYKEYNNTVYIKNAIELGDNDIVKIETNNIDSNIGKGLHSAIIKLTQFLNDIKKSKNINESVEEGKEQLKVLFNSIKDKWNQSHLNVIKTIANKFYMNKWSDNYSKIDLKLTNKNLFQYTLPEMNLDLVNKLLDGKWDLSDFLEKSDTIKMVINPNNIAMKETWFSSDFQTNDFLESAVKFYENTAPRLVNKFIIQIKQLGHNFNHIIRTNSELASLVIVPIHSLFIFNDIYKLGKNFFKDNEKDFNDAIDFIKQITSNYKDIEDKKVQKQIVDDLKNKVLKDYKENCEIDDNYKYYKYLPEAVEKLYNNKYSELITEASNIFIKEQIDNSISDVKKIQLIREAAKVKRLKKIPSDLIAYITIETESIQDANDKMMIYSYASSRVEIVEWYIELLDTGSNRYIVPHTRQQLETIRTQLIECLKKIMNVKIINPSDRSIIEIKYPKGYEG